MWFILPLSGLTVALLLVGILIWGLCATGIILPIAVGCILGLLLYNSPAVFISVFGGFIGFIIFLWIFTRTGKFFVIKAGFADTHPVPILQKIYDVFRYLSWGLLSVSAFLLIAETIIELIRDVTHTYPIATVLYDICGYTWDCFLFALGGFALSFVGLFLTFHHSS